MNYNEQEINQEMNAWRATTFPKVKVAKVETGTIYRTEGYCPTARYCTAPEFSSVCVIADRVRLPSQDHLIEDLKELETTLYTTLPNDGAPEGVVTYRGAEFWNYIPDIGFHAYLSYTGRTGFMCFWDTPELWAAA
jgi:hypothetical protein